MKNCNEVVEAIEDGDNVALMEELGDLLLHIVMQTQLASESGAFNIIDVLNHINDKLVRRHPHVFGELELKDADTVKKNWERLKKAEKQERKSVLEGIPRALPALIYAQRMQEKAASVGFDWDDVPPILEKIDEETKELKSALETEDQTRIKESGRFTLYHSESCRKLHLDAESALKKQQGSSLNDSSI